MVPVDQAAILVERAKQLIETVAQLHPEQPGVKGKASLIAFPITTHHD